MRQHDAVFDHNLHALRIVEHFEQRYADFPGLNLTFEVREGIIKHSRDYNSTEHPQLAEYLLDERPPLEAQLIDLTDEIGYNTADLDDGYEAKLLKLDKIREHVRIFERFYRDADEQHPNAPEKLKFNEALKRMLDLLVTDLIENTRVNVERAFATTLEDVRKFPQRLAAFSPEVEDMRREAKHFLYDNLYYSSPLRPEKLDADRIITDLFQFWFEHPETLPPSYQHQAKHEPLHRVICDYIAGMTDNYVLEQHKRLLKK
jgi:dGTPase